MKLRVAGVGPELNALRALSLELQIDSRVEFVGHVSDVAGFLSESDALIHAATSEAFGLVLVEALSQGVPVIATKTSGAVEIHAATGQIVLSGQGDILGMASSIADLAKQPVDPHPLIESVRQYSAASVASQYIDFFQAVTGATP